MLDLSDGNGDALTVGYVFQEGTNISDRTVKVVQSPPDPNELHNPQRYGSILPESSARPRKRLLGLFLSAPRNSLHDTAYTGNREAGTFEGNGRSHKRQKAHDSRLYSGHDSDRPIHSREGFEDGLYTSSQSSGRHASPVHQVPDSQRSPKKKRGLKLSLPLRIRFM